MAGTQPGEGGPGAPPPLASAADVLGAEISVAEIDPFLTDLEQATSVEDLIARADRITAFRTPGFSPAEQVISNDTVTQLRTAVSDGYVPPSEVGAALRWALKAAKLAAITGAFVAGGELYRQLVAYGHAHGHHGGKPVVPAKAPATGSIVVGGEGEGARTPGGRIVGAAERGVARATVKVPGLTPTEAKGISLAIARSYGDVMHVLITVVNELTAEIRAVGDLVGTVRPTTHEAPPAPAVVPKSVTVALSGIEAELARLVHGQGVLDARIANVESGLTGARQQIATTTGRVQEIVHGLPGLVGGIVAGATGGLATATDLGKLQGELTAEKGAVAGLQSELQTAGVPNLPTEIAGLEDCCAENKAVTQPIKEGGATPSLLRRLGGLLTYGYALGLIAGFVGTLLTILDTPASILGTIRGAEWVMPIAERAALQALGDVTWSDTIATAS